MSAPATFEEFEKELHRLVEVFGKHLPDYKSPRYDEANVRKDFLDPLFSALGWDMGNRAGLIPAKREVEIESRTTIGGRQKRADYLFRTDGRERFVCEAKKPAVELEAKEAFQAKRYAWNKGLPLAVLTDFEDVKFYIVGGKPKADEVGVGLWKSWHFLELPAKAREFWDLLSRDAVAAGSIDKLIEALPKKATGKGKARQQWLIKPDRSRALDTDFLNFLDEARHELASDLYKHNEHAYLLEGDRLNEAVQRILDRLLFLRICEDRDIDTGTYLQTIVQTWQRNNGREDDRPPRQQFFLDEPPGAYGAAGIRAPKDSLWHAVVRHFRALDRRPASHVPFFNGNLFKEHFSETLIVSDEWLVDFIGELSDDESPYLFNVIPVEILGTIYERFLGKVVRPHGRGVTIEEKPEVRKAGGVYYTPSYIVDYIVEQTVGKLVAEKSPETSLKLRILDPACGSGSFLIRAYERMCEHWQQWLTRNPDQRKKKWCRVDVKTQDVYLTVGLKRQILTSNIYGVDLDASAVEVTQLSLYLKMLENENRTTIQRESDLFDEAQPLLPPLQDNIKCGNSLIASDFSLVAEDLVRVRAFDWDVAFEKIMKAGGFDAVVGNPPYVLIGPEIFDEQSIDYLRRYQVAQYKADLFHVFIEKGIALNKSKGLFGMIVPNTWLTLQFTDRLRRFIVDKTSINELVIFEHLVFEDANVFTALLFLEKGIPNSNHKVAIRNVKNLNAGGNIFDFAPTLVEQSNWSSNESCIFETRLTGPSGRLVERLVKGYPPLEAVARASLGCQAYNSSKHSKDQIEKRVFHATHKIGSDYLPELAGNDVGRYEINRIRGQWIKYGPWLHDYRTMDWLKGPRILIREISGAKPYSIYGSYTEETYCHYKTILNVNPSDVTRFSMKCMLGVLNSKLISFIYPFVSNKLVVQAFPRLSVRDVKRLPMVNIDLKDAFQKTRHDKIVALVDKLLQLVPRLHLASNEAERATLQNAVTATDRQIDQLVYELYGLTPEEIALVEEGT